MAAPVPRPVHLAVDLSDAGARPGTWRGPGPRADRPFVLDELVELVATARRGALDFVVLDERFSVRTTRRTTLGGRLDAALVSARLGPRSAGVGLVATLSATETAPVDVARALAAVDHASNGRAGWQVGLGAAADGGDPAAEVRAARTVARLWERWDDGTAERAPVDLAAPDVTGYVARDGVHFAAPERAALPRPVQGLPPVVVRAADLRTLAAAGAVADVVRVRAADADAAARQRAEVRAAAVAAGRDPDAVRVLVDVYAVLGPDRASAQARLDLVSETDGQVWDAASLVHVGAAEDLGRLVAGWVREGAADGFTVRPSTPRVDLDALVDGVVPALRDAGLHRWSYPGTTLRRTLGLPVPGEHLASSA